MEPKEKAEELFKKMYQVRSVAGSDVTKYFAKQSALVAVDEVLKAAFYASDEIYTYYLEVKQEIEKL